MLARFSNSFSNPTGAWNIGAPLPPTKCQTTHYKTCCTLKGISITSFSGLNFAPGAKRRPEKKSYPAKHTRTWTSQLWHFCVSIICQIWSLKGSVGGESYKGKERTLPWSKPLQQKSSLNWRLWQQAAHITITKVPIIYQCASRAAECLTAYKLWSKVLRTKNSHWTQAKINVFTSHRKVQYSQKILNKMSQNPLFCKKNVYCSQFNIMQKNFDKALNFDRRV